jgi:nitroreductase
VDRSGAPASPGARPDAVADLLRGRRTVDRFLPDAPPQDVLDTALDLARWAPNHKLTEPWRFYLLGPDTVSGVVSLNARLVADSKGAEAGEMKRRKWSAIPGWFVLSCVQDDDALRRREDYAACCCAAQNIMLYLWSRGVGSKWTTGAVTRDDAFYRLLGIDPALEEVVGLFWYGYPAGEPQSLREPVSQRVQYLK